MRGPRVVGDRRGEDRGESGVTADACVEGIHMLFDRRLRHLGEWRGHRKITRATITTTAFQNSISTRVRIMTRSSDCVAPRRSATISPGRKKTFKANFMASFMATLEDVSEMHLGWPSAESNIPNASFVRSRQYGSTDRRIDGSTDRRIDGSTRILAHMIDNVGAGHGRLPDATQHQQMARFIAEPGRSTNRQFVGNRLARTRRTSREI